MKELVKKFLQPSRRFILFGNGCAGQNKNQHVVRALTFWLQKNSTRNIQQMVIYFPVEKRLLKSGDVLDPTASIEIYKEHGTVKALGEYWFIKNHKDLREMLKQIDGISGVSTETYRRRILFARVSHLACDILPGDLLAKSLGNTPVEIASTILYKYFWSVLISLAESSGKLVGIGLNLLIGLFSQFSRSLPIVPENVRGPEVLPSIYWNRCLNGSSFIWNKQIIHCKGLPNRFSSSRIIPPYMPTFTLVPSHPIAVKSSTDISAFKKKSNISFAIHFAVPEAGVI
ncbi:unnamed protein product [Acanthoscelides obtectus]|uniref:Uncharacterized protein n=1 Tax=Acanthoscelides obtectus TaxID=200917 RepID=A0A9P0LW25_ACAOB|nr:unnamed protein product [Acanthoscelides obtectus]CAK1620290.1 hypothetical protein AOBTE_LOCUS284 [Acanthoscelides obtectus]